MPTRTTTNAGDLSGTPAPRDPHSAETPRAADDRVAAGPRFVDGPLNRVALGTLAALVGVLVWSYYEPVAYLVGRWWNEPDYVYGFLVPLFSGYLLWLRRSMLHGAALQGSWWGLTFLAVAAAMRFASAYYSFNLVVPQSLLPCLAGVVLFVGGWKALQWSWPAIVFLGFMVPLQGFLSGMLSHPLQRIGTIVGTYVIQTLGVPAVDQGNVIVLANGRLGVVEACSGLKMMMLFFAVCVGAAFVVRRHVLVKLLIVASAVPIAVLANVARIVLTAILYQVAGPEWGERLFHDLAGWFLMPLAVVLLWLELELAARIVTERAPAAPIAPVLAPVSRNPSPNNPRRRKQTRTDSAG